MNGAVLLALSVFELPATILNIHIEKQEGRQGVIGLCCATGFSCLSLAATPFILCWFLAGNVWVFGRWSSVTFDNGSSADYCDKAAYMLSFINLILGWYVLF